MADGPYDIIILENNVDTANARAIMNSIMFQAISTVVKCSFTAGRTAGKRHHMHVHHVGSGPMH